MTPEKMKTLLDEIPTTTKIQAEIDRNLRERKLLRKMLEIAQEREKLAGKTE